MIYLIALAFLICGHPVMAFTLAVLALATSDE